jgi:hypothetical protein
LTVCPELCVGLFLRSGAELPAQAPQDIPIITEGASDEDVLIGHVISTMSTNKPVRDEDMACPPEWKTNPQADYEVGHKKNGTTIALHALAVSPKYQRSGFGKALMTAYIGQMKKAGRAERISILTYDRLVPYYQKLGFEHYGKSESEYAGVAWHDLVSTRPERFFQMSLRAIVIRFLIQIPTCIKWKDSDADMSRQQECGWADLTEVDGETRYGFWFLEQINV